MTEAETRIKPNSLPQVAIRLIRLATNPDVDFAVRGPVPPPRGDTTDRHYVVR